jgi:hypothetical protein
MEKENARAGSLPTSRGHISKRSRRECSASFFFALDLKSEIKQELYLQNVLSTLLGKLVGTGSIKISRTVLPGWDPD